MKQQLKGALLPALMMLMALPSFGQQFVHGLRFGGVGEDVVKSTATDANGNTYITGYFTDSSDFDPGDGEYNLTANGFYDVFVLKLNAAGEFVWARSMGGPFSDYATSVAVNDQGEVYLTCVFEESADFDPGEGEFELISNGILDVAIVKLDADGDFLWASSFGSESYEEATAIALDEAGNVYVTGYFDTPIPIGGAGVMLESQGGQDLFVLKMDPQGALLWARTVGGPEQELALNLVTGAGGIFIAGSFGSTVDFDPGEGEAIRTSAGSMDGYVLHLTGDGDFGYATTFGGSGGDLAYSVAVDGDNNAVAVGSFMEDFAAGDSIFTSVEWEDGFAVKLDSQGSVVWAAQIAGTEYQNVYDVSIDAAGHVLLAGYFNGIADMDPGAAESLFEPQSPQPFDAFLTVLNADGEWVYSGQFGGSDFLEHHGVSVDAEGNIYLSAAYQGSVDLDPGADNTATVTNAGFRDSYWIKLSPVTSTGVATPWEAAVPLRVFPNPASGFIHISAPEIPSSGLNEYTYSIHDQTGRLVQQGFVRPTEFLGVSALAAGVYTIRLATAEKVWVGKWLKQ